MRKFSIVLSILVLSAIMLAAGPANLGDVKQPVMPQRPIGGRPGPAPDQLLILKKTLFGYEEGFIGWIYKNLPDVEVRTQVKDIEVIGGEFFITVEATGEEYKIYIAPMLLNFLKMTVKQGDKIEVKGKKIVLKRGTMVIPERLRINGRDYNIKALLEQFKKIRFQKVPFENPVEQPIKKLPRKPKMP